MRLSGNVVFNAAGIIRNVKRMNNKFKKKNLNFFFKVRKNIQNFGVKNPSPLKLVSSTSPTFQIRGGTGCFAIFCGKNGLKLLLYCQL